MKKKEYREYILITFFAILFMGVFYSFRELIPWNVDWLLWSDADRAQHYTGWLFYRKEAWSFPLGNFTGLSYPNGMSIIYLDAIPLFAVLFKLMHFPALSGTLAVFWLVSIFVRYYAGNFVSKITKKIYSWGTDSNSHGNIVYITANFFVESE